jgi:multidrug resistance efflux pump
VNPKQFSASLANPKRLGTPNLVTLCAALGLLGASSALWMQFTRVRAREAIVEVRTLTLKSPIEGLVTSLEVKAGERIHKGQSLFYITNSRVPKPRIGDLQIALSAAEAKLQMIQLQEERAKRILATADTDFARQSRLQISRQQEELTALIRKRQQAAQEASFAGRNYARRYHLYKQGAIAFDEVDRTGTSLAQARAEVRLGENKIKAQKMVVEAARKNLTLIATRGGADPETFHRESANRLAIIQEEKQDQSSRIRALKKQLSQANKEYEINRFANVPSPINGVVWTIDHYAGSSIREQETILSILDCSERWINTYVREGDIKNLNIGQSAEISLYGSNLKLKGKVSLIRSGIGRSSTGSDITPLLPINMYREAQVKVAIEKGQGPSQNPGNLCFSGYTGKVTFLP